VQHLTQDKAETELQRLARQGQCAAERTSASWSARGHGQTSGGSNTNGSGSDSSDDGRSDTDSDRPDAGPTGRR